MKRQILKVGALLAAATLAFAGCGSSGDGGGGKTPAGGDVSLDFNGEEIVFAYPWGLESPDASPSAKKHYDYVQELNKKYNVVIKEESINGSYYNTNMVTTILAQKPMGHVMIGYPDYITDYYKAGVCAVLNDAMTQTGIDFKDGAIYNQNVTKFLNFDGKQIGFSNSVEVLKDLWFVNMRMMKEASIDIYDIVDKGEWTWDKAEELGRRLTKDTNNDGTPDVYGIGTSTTLGLCEALAVSNNATFCKVDANNKPVLNWTDAPVLDAINRVYKWCTTDRICKPALSNTAWTQMATDFINGSYAMIHGPIDYLSSFEDAAMKDDFGVIPVPKGPKQDSDWYTAKGEIAYYHFIPVTYQDRAAELIQLYQELSINPEGLTKAEVWQDQYLDRVRDDKSMEYLMKLGFGGYQRLDLTGVLCPTWGDPSLATVFEHLAQNSTSPGSAIQEYSSKFQAEMDDRWEGITLTGVQ